MNSRSFAIVSITALTMVGACFLLLTPSEAQEPPAPQPPNLFTPAGVPDWVDPLLPDNATILRSRPVTVDFDVLADAQPAEPGADPLPVPITFNLFDDLSVTAVFHKAKPRYSMGSSSEPYAELTGYLWHGRLVGDEHEGHVVMITNSGVWLADIHIAGVGWFKIRAVEGTQHAVREIRAAAEEECGVIVAADLVDPGPEPDGGGPGGGGGCGISVLYPCEQGTTIDVMVLYTPAARDAAAEQHLDIESEIEMAIAATNQAYVNSLISIQLDLVHVEEVQISGPLTLPQVQRPWDNILDEIHALRDSVRADLVCVVGGPGQTGAFAFVMKTESPVFERLGFSVAFWASIGPPNYHMAHEIGHNMGTQHARHQICNFEGDCECHAGVCGDSFGYNLPPEDPSYKTIMASSVGINKRIPNFSNPNVDHLGYPTGVALPSCDSADNAKTINETAETIANLRASCDTANTTAMASSDFFVGQADAASREVSISDNGQYMAFTSDATIFIPEFHGEAEPGVSDVYLYNRESGLVWLVSTHQIGAPGEANSYAPAISGDGHYIAFASDATDLFLNTQDSNNETDIYVAEQFEIGQATRVSVTTTEGQSVGGGSFAPSMTFDGRFVAFASDATNLVGADGNLARDIFLRDRDGDGDLNFDEPGNSSTARVSLTTAGGEANGGSFNPAISAEDGQFVAFESDADNLLATADTNGVRDIFVRDRLGQSTFRVSISTAGVAGDLASFAPSISADGLLVVFATDATNLVSDDDNDVRDIFIRDLGAVPATTTRISVASDGTQAIGGHSFAPAISADGRFVAFHSDATNLLGAGVDTNAQTDVFVHDLATGETVRASINSLGEQATGGPSSFAAISDDGRFIGYGSDATNLVPGDTSGFRDFFFRDRGSMCVGDFNNDFIVGPADLAILLGNWGPVPGCPPTYVVYDLDFDCDIGEADLAILLGNWGVCL